MATETQAYTREELDKLSRTNLRRAAVACGMPHRDATKMESSDLKDYIENKQGGGGGEEKARGKDKGNGKPATAKVRGRKAKSAPAQDVEEQVEAEEERGSGNGETGGLADMIHKVGLGMDDGFKEIMGVVEDLQAKMEEQASEIHELRHTLYIVSGLTADVLKGDWEPTDVDERVEELEASWQAQEDGGEGNEE